MAAALTTGSETGSRITYPVTSTIKLKPLTLVHVAKETLQQYCLLLTLISY